MDEETLLPCKVCGKVEICYVFTSKIKSIKLQAGLIFHHEEFMILNDDETYILCTKCSLKYNFCCSTTIPPKSVEKCSICNAFRPSIYNGTQNWWIFKYWVVSLVDLKWCHQICVDKFDEFVNKRWIRKHPISIDDLLLAISSFGKVIIPE